MVFESIKGLQVPYNRKIMNLKNLKPFADLFIRLPIGFHLIYGTQDNIFSWERMLEFRDFLTNLNIPAPLVAAHLSVYAQFICGILFILGWKTRWAAAIMIFNFIIALALVHLHDPYPNKFPAIMMLCGSIFLLLHGAGKFSIEGKRNKTAKSWYSWDIKNIYFSFCQVFENIFSVSRWK